MKTRKKLKLDSLNLNELENKEANKVVGGIVCTCRCYCTAYNEKSYSSWDEVHVVVKGI